MPSFRADSVRREGRDGFEGKVQAKENAREIEALAEASSDPFPAARRTGCRRRRCEPSRLSGGSRLETLLGRRETLCGIYASNIDIKKRRRSV